MDKRECFLGAFSQTERFRGGPLAFQDGTSRRARRLLNLGRNKVKRVMHLVTGHSTLKKHLYNLIGAMDKQKNCKTVVVVCKEYDKKPGIHIATYINSQGIFHSCKEISK